MFTQSNNQSIKLQAPAPGAAPAADDGNYMTLGSVTTEESKPPVCDPNYMTMHGLSNDQFGAPK